MAVCLRSFLTLLAHTCARARTHTHTRRQAGRQARTHAHTLTHTLPPPHTHTQTRARDTPPSPSPLSPTHCSTPFNLYPLPRTPTENMWPTPTPTPTHPQQKDRDLSPLCAATTRHRQISQRAVGHAPASVLTVRAALHGLSQQPGGYRLRISGPALNTN